MESMLSALATANHGCFCYTDPEWCCLSRGVFLCITCAGIHRRLHGSMVRSCRLDAWRDHMVDVSIG